MLLQMYKKTPCKQNGNSSDKELIDISSDDDVSKAESKTEKETKEADLVYNTTDESVHISPSVTLKLEVSASKPASTSPPPPPLPPPSQTPAAVCAVCMHV